jgi:hypothetical protein
LFIFIHICINPNLQAQQKINISGIIIDQKTNKPLSYANIQIVGANLGSTSNIDGRFEMFLDSASYSLNVTYIGYESRIVKVNQSLKNLIIKLIPKPIEGEVIEVYAYNWIERFILKSIDKKKLFKERLLYYKSLAYSKTTLSSTKSNKLFAIIEAISKLAYKSPDMYKETVLNLKMPPYMKNVPYQSMAVNQQIDLYNEEIKIQRFSLLSPLNDEALNYYNYKISKQFFSGQDTIISINVIPKYSDKPLLRGKLFFNKTTHQLVEAKLFGNASVQDQVSDSLSLYIKYSILDSNFVLPLLTKFKLLMNFIGYSYNYTQENSFVDYSINNPFDRPFITTDRLVSIEPNLTYDIGLKRDEIFNMPLTEKESIHNQQIDRIFNKAPLHKRIFLFLFTDLLPLSFDQPASIGKLKINKFSNWYHFNKVEGHFLGLEHQLLNDDSFNIYTQFGYSFGRESLFYNIRSRFRGLLFQFKNHIVNLGRFDYNQTGNTIAALFSHHDNLHYYKSITYALSYNLDFSSKFNTKLGVYFENQFPIHNVTNFSLFNKNEIYSPNFLINEYSNNKIGIELSYLENYEFFNNRPIIFNRKSFTNVSISYYIQNKSILKSTEDRSILNLILHRFQPINYPIALDLKLIWHKQDKSDFIQEVNFTSSVKSIFERENYLDFFTLNNYDYYVNDYIKLTGELILFNLPDIYTFRRMSVGSIVTYLKPFETPVFDTRYFNRLDKEFYEYGIIFKGISFFNFYIMTNNTLEKHVHFRLRMYF